MKRLDGKTILVAGGTDGIGRAAVKKLIENGASVIFCGRNESKAESLLQELRGDSGRARFYRCDFSDAKSIENLFSAVFSSVNILDGAFNNVGIEGEIAQFCDSTEENWDNVFNVNLKSIWRCMKFEVPHMVQAGRGVIVNMSSTSGFVGNGYGMTAYAASKHAIIGLSKSVALEQAKNNIRVISLCPGFVETPMFDRLCAIGVSARRRFISQEPIGRAGRAEEIANAVVYLCSDEASFVTGSNFVIDGGLTI